MRILLKKLKRLIYEEYKLSVNITISTALDNRINAVTNGKDILINANNIKSIDLILKACAHELVHVLFHYDDNAEEFENELTRIETNLINLYRGIK